MALMARTCFSVIRRWPGSICESATSRVLRVVSVQPGLQDLDSPPFLLVSDHVFQIAIMKKETVYVHVESAQVKEQMLREFQECIDTSAAVRKSLVHPRPF
jgi:hypothetical protein